MPRTLKEVGNEGNANKIPDFCRDVGLADALKLAPASLKSAVSANKLTLPNFAKAFSVLSVYATAGTVTGALTVVTASPTTGQVQLTPTGDLVFFATDAVTAVEVTYLPIEGKVIEIYATADGTGAIPTTSMQGYTARLIIDAEQLSGGAIATKTVIARGGTPTAGQVGATVTGGVKFHTEAASSKVRVKFVAYPKPSVLEKLDSTVYY